jgi:peptide/nickel transport system permease protein
MTAYIIRRLLLLPVILFGVTFIIFAMISVLSPNQRLALYVSDVPKRPDQTALLIQKYGLNDPMPEQYARWVAQLAHGNLGFSKIGKAEVVTVIKNRLPATAELALWSILPIILVGVQLGILAALRHNKPTDHALRLFSIVGTSLPTFVFGLLVLMIFAAKLQWLPAGGRLSLSMKAVVESPAWNSYTGMYTVDAILNANPQVFFDAVQHLILPVLTLAYLNWAILLRVTRSSMLDTLRQDYVRTALAKGVAWRTVVQKHARPNAMLPVATIGGLQLIALLNGVVITETVFNWPGLGKVFADAARNLDIVAVLGFTMFNATVLVLGNLAVDVFYAYLDPRVRLS